MKIFFLFAICSCGWAQLDRPALGKVLDGNGTIRTVYGIAASVTVGDGEVAGALSSGCSETLCLIKTETSILSIAGSVDAPAGPALFAFDGDAAFVWFPLSRQLARWQNGGLMPVDSSVDGEVLSIRARDGSVEFAVRRESGVWIVRSDGSLADSVGPSTGPVMLITDGVVYATREEIVVRGARIRLSGVTSFSQMSGAYLQVRAKGVDYALRTEKGRETLFQLPGVPQ
jgi:hypothetical protein